MLVLVQLQSLNICASEPIPDVPNVNPSKFIVGIYYSHQNNGEKSLITYNIHC